MITLSDPTFASHFCMRPNFASQFCMRLYFTNILDGGNKRRLKMCLRVVFRSKQLFRRKKRSGKHLKCPILLEMVRQLRYLSEKFPKKVRRLTSVAWKKDYSLVGRVFVEDFWSSTIVFTRFLHDLILALHRRLDRFLGKASKQNISLKKVQNLSLHVSYDTVLLFRVKVSLQLGPTSGKQSRCTVVVRFLWEKKTVQV